MGGKSMARVARPNFMGGKEWQDQILWVVRVARVARPNFWGGKSGKSGKTKFYGW